MHKLRVLVVDDNPLFLNAAHNLLSGLPEVGCAEYVNSGAAALKSGAAGLISKMDFAAAIPELLATLARESD